MKKLLQKIPVTTVVGILGFTALIFGIWQIHRPSAWIVGGLMVLVMSILLAASERRAENPNR